MQLPPSCETPTSKETRVRFEGFWKMSPIVRPFRRSLCRALFAFTFLVSSMISSTSSFERSSSLNKCRDILFPHRLKRFFQNMQRLIGLLLGNVQGRHQPQHVALGAIDDEPVIKTFFVDRLTFDRQLNTDHEPDAAHF